MNPTRPAWPSAPLARRLRRLRLLEDERFFPELSRAGIPIEVQQTLLESTRSTIRYWMDRTASGVELTTTELLLALESLRQQPALAAPLLAGLRGASYDRASATCALNAGRSLHNKGRQYYAEQMLDVSTNYMLEAQRELSFALSTGSLLAEERTEALGKFAVAVAFSSRWNRTSTSVLNRALEFHRESISSGNQTREAYSYLIELLVAKFNETSDVELLKEAIAIATNHSLLLEQSELMLKLGIYKHSHRIADWISDLQRAQDLATASRPMSGVDYVKKALVSEFALSAIARPCPLDATQIRLPYGFLRALPRISLSDRSTLRADVLDALLPMRRMLNSRGKRPNLVAQQVLFAVLRDSVSQGTENAKEDSGLLVQISEESLETGDSRYHEYQHADALLARATVTPTLDVISEAVHVVEALVERYPAWPLPRVALAHTRTLWARSGGGDDAQDAAVQAWVEAVRWVINSSDYHRTDLGGRSGVFAVEDARGDISTALIFKPADNPANAEQEASHMRLLRDAITAHDAGDRFGVSSSLGIIRLHESQIIHVIERQIGTRLSELHVNEAADLLSACVELTALFQNSAPKPDQDRSGWRKLKSGLKLWSRTLFQDHGLVDQYIRAMKSCYPDNLPLVRKRDAHASNWVVDGAGRIIAVDLEAVSFLPVGHDIAQLIEDCGLLPVNEEGFARRAQLIRDYVGWLDIRVETESVLLAYDWFALSRAIRVVSSATASRSHHVHARQLAAYLATTAESDGLRECARTVRNILHHTAAPKIQQPPDNTHRRMSKRLAWILRHQAPHLGLSVDTAGFVPVDELADAVQVKLEEILVVATHPAEPRFEVEDGCVRALYGHSFEVEDLPDLDVETPTTLFHGTSWDSLPRIAEEGLRPMGRQKVHLTNNPTEALEVASRHQRPALLAVSPAGVECLRAAADAVWTADGVDRDGLQVSNPFAQAQAPPEWLAASIASGEIVA